MAGPQDVSIDAVVFDLFGTLVPEFPKAEFYEVIREMAGVLGADPDAFEDEWMRTAIARQTGAYPGGVRENVAAVCAAVGAGAEPAALDAALEPRVALYDRWFHPRPGALETLAALKERRYPVALISMCAPDTPALWRASELAPFVDVEVFSSEVGLRKPDPAIYRLACNGLGVEPEACLYCGDGAYGELSGAAAVGMTVYLISDPALEPSEALRPEGEDWDGARVGDLRELLDVLPPRRQAEATPGSSP